MNAYRSLVGTDRPSALGNFLQPMADGFAGGIEDDRVRRRNLSDKVQAYESLIQPQLKLYQGQQDIQRQGQSQAADADLMRKLILQSRNPQHLARTELSSLVGQPVSETRPAGSPFPMEDSGEAMAKPESWTGKTSVPVTSPGVDPRRIASLAVQAKVDPKDLQGILRLARGGGGSVSPQAQPGFDLVRTMDEEGGVKGYREVRSPSASSSALNNPYAIARAAAGLAPGQQPDSEQARQIYSIVERHARLKGISPRAQVFNDVMNTTGDIRQAEQAATIFEESLAKASGAGRTIGQNTGEALTAKVSAAGQVGQATAEGGIRGKLSPVAAPYVPGQPPLPSMPGAAAVTASQQQAKNITEPLQGADRTKYQMLSASSRQTDYVKQLYRPEFVGKGFAPFVQGVQKEFANQEKAASEGKYAPGALAGATRQFFGNISQEEATFRKAVLDVSDMILRARSGAQINEQEYQRMKGLLYNLTDEPAVFVAGLNRFSDEVSAMMQDVSKAAVGPASALGTGPLTQRAQPSPKATPRLNTGPSDPLEGKTATGPTGQKIIRRNGAWVPYGK